MSSPTKVLLRWVEGEAFEIVEPATAGSLLDGDRQVGLSPMESLLASLCACMGIDIVMILVKMRTDLQSLEIRALGYRNPEPPRYFQRMELDFRIRGEVSEKQANRAIDLSFDKYCSVFHSLRSNLDVVRRVSRD